MKTISCAMLLLAIPTFVLLGCSDQSSPLAVSNDPIGSASSSGEDALPLAKSAEVKHMAAGCVQMFLWEGAGGVAYPPRRHTSFVAREAEGWQLFGDCQDLGAER